MSKLSERIDRTILHSAIIEGEELTRDYVVKKREKILKNHMVKVKINFRF